MAEAVPAEMRAVEITRPGGPEVLAPTTRPVPAPAGGEVLIAVHAAGINRPDVAQREGNYNPPPGTTDIPGLEVAGEIVAVGEGVDAGEIGRKVCALVAGGGYADYVTAPLPQCLAIPDGLDLMAAAALPETVMTVWTNLFDGGDLKAGESLLVHGGSSGIGTIAIQIGVAFGATVFATAGSADKCEACAALGAARAINYRDQDFVEVVKEATGGKGVDVVLDMVGGDYVARNIQAMARFGRHVSIASLGGPNASIPIFQVMAKRLTLTGSTLRPRSIEEKAAIARTVEEKVWPLVAGGRIKPLVHTVLPLEEAAQGHALMESSTHIGKIMLAVRPA